MRIARRAVAVALGLGLVALAPAAAEAKTKTVDMGTNPAAQKKLRAYGADVNDFFPHGVTIHVGDKVKFVPSSFHTVEFPAKGKDPVSFAIPDGNTIAGVNDAAGQPFWFNGQPEFNFNPAVGPPGLYGKHVSYNGTKDVQSGLPVAAKPKPFTIKFTKAGRYTYYCNLHPGMKGTVRVKKGGSIPTAKQDKKTLRTQINRDVKIAKRLATRHVPANTVDVGEAGPHGVEYFGMLPGNVTVPVGTRIAFRMTQGSYEDHTATFGPGNPETEPNSYLGTIAAGFGQPPLDQRAIYPSEAPGPSATLTPALHGNGFWNSGVMDTSDATPLQASNSVTFGAPGKYDYYCLIHPFMHGTVTVVP